MEHPCLQCGSMVEDGRPFCPQCRAPQIHVQIAVPDNQLGAGLDSTPDTLSAEQTLSRGSGLPPIIAGSTMDRNAAIRAALKAGALGVFIGMIPLLGIVLTGALAVYLYRRQSHVVLPAALGWRLGGAAGVFSYAINSLLITIQIFIFHAQQRYIDEITNIIQRFGADASDPAMQASIHNLFTPAGLALTFFFGMVVSIVLASIGGALSSLIMRSGDSPGQQ